MKPYDALTYRYPRTTNGLWPCNADEAIACHAYRAPAHKRAAQLLIKYGWLAAIAAASAIAIY